MTNDFKIPSTRRFEDWAEGAVEPREPLAAGSCAVLWALRALLVAGVIGALSSCGGSINHWDDTGGPPSESPPAISAFTDGNIHMAVADNSGSVQVAHTDEPERWSDWQQLSQAPVGGFAPDTSPVLSLLDEESGEPTKLYLFARSVDNNLYVAEAAEASGQFNGWGAWKSVTSDGSVTGRIFVAVSAPDEFHVAHTTGDICRYLRVFSGITEEAKEWSNCSQMSITRVSRNLVALAGVVNNNLELTWVDRTANWSLSDPNRIFINPIEMSNLVWFEDAIHFVSVDRVVLDDVGDPLLRFDLIHRWVDPEDGAWYEDVRLIDSYNEPPDGIHAIPALTEYRGRLISLWTKSGGELDAARWDVADPKLPWIVYRNVGQGSAVARPTIISFDHRPWIESSEYKDPRYGDDSYAAVADTSDRPQFLVLSREMMREDIRHSFTTHDATHPDCADGGPDCQPDVPSRIVTRDDRAVVTEIGFSLWMMPNWLGRDLFPAFVDWNCGDNGNWTEDDVPCRTGRLPVFIKGSGGLFNWLGAWIREDSRAINVWEETGHYAAPSLGFGTSLGVSAESAERTGIEETVLQIGASLFRENTCWPCPSAPRRTGFTGISNNYDATGSEHSFIYTVYHYLERPAVVRQFVQEDLAGGDDLLQQKYEWVRDHIFGGIEF